MITVLDDYGAKKRKTVYGNTKVEFSEKLSKLNASLSSESIRGWKGKNIGETMKDWLLIFKKSFVSPRTFEINMRNFKNHIEPNIGKVKINDIEIITIQ